MCDTIIKPLVKRHGVSTECEEISWKVSCLQWKECIMLPDVLVLCIVERAAIGDTDDTMNMAGAGHDAKQEVRGGEGRATVWLTSDKLIVGLSISTNRTICHPSDSLVALRNCMVLHSLP